MFACVSCFLPFPTILSIHMCALNDTGHKRGTDQCGKVHLRSDLHILHITLNLWCVNVNAVDVYCIYIYIHIYIYILIYYRLL